MVMACPMKIKAICKIFKNKNAAPTERRFYFIGLKNYL
jgi:hypothetical protein